MSPTPYFRLDAPDKRQVLAEVAQASGTARHIVEKDIWLCWMLDTVFRLPDAASYAFKGGTSLSKVHGVITRFSEDVDITADYRLFLPDEHVFADGISRSRLRRLSDQLRAMLSEHLHDVVVPGVVAAYSDIGNDGGWSVDVDAKGESVVFSYPAVAPTETDYVSSAIIVEFGARNVIDHSGRHSVFPDAAAVVTDLSFPGARDITVISPERTFWEKATLIHAECVRHRFARGPERMSRHWYDIAAFERHPSLGSALAQRDTTLRDVIRYKDTFYYNSMVSYDDVLQGQCQLVPDAEGLRHLEQDFAFMLDSGMVSDEDVSFAGVMDAVKRVERGINRGIPQKPRGPTP